MSAPEPRLEMSTTAPDFSPGDLVPVSFKGREALSETYEYEVDLVSRESFGIGSQALEAFAMHPLMLRFGASLDTVVHGIVAKVRTEASNHEHDVHYIATVVPKMWLLSRTRRSRIFQDQSVPQIVAAILTELGLEQGPDFEMRLGGQYGPSEYTVQYHESDLDFVDRLLQHFGIFYFFAQHPDREKVVFSDSNRGFEVLDGHETLTFEARDGSVDHGSIRSWAQHFSPQPAAVVLRDYNWRTPSVPLQSQAVADERTPRGFQNEYGEHFKTPAVGNLLATLRAQELMSRRMTYEGECSVEALAPGHRFDLSGHVIGEFDQPYGVTAVEHEATAASASAASRFEYLKTVHALPLAVPYRPPRRTARPRIVGFMHARVDGEVPGTAAPIDEYGRYKVIFPFDLVGEPGGKASRWVRMAQASSGPGYGVHFPLHIGVEVVIAHLDGDPDRPVIMASPPNAETVTPVNESNATQSQIRTKAGIIMTWDDDC